MNRDAHSATWPWVLAAFNGVAATAAHLCLAHQLQVTAVGLFQIAAMLAHFSTLSVLLAVVPWFMARLGVRNGVSMTAAVLIFGTLLLVVVVNAMVYALYKFHLNSMVWFLLTQGAAMETLSFSSQMWVTAVAVAASMYAIQAGALWWIARSAVTLPRIRRYAIAVLCIGISTQFINAYADATAQRSLLMATRAIPWAQPLTAKSFLARFGLVATRGESTDLALRTPGVFSYPLARMQCTGASKPNVLMIVVDSLRFDMVNADVMPSTSAWARDATRFEHHYSTGNGTRFGIFGLMYGLPGGYWHAALAERRGPVLIDVLDDLGYQFFVFGSAPLDSPEFHRTAFTRIWNRVAPSGAGDVVERDRATTRDLIDSMQNRDRSRPFFGFLFLDSPHAYAHPPEMTSPFQPHLDSVNYVALNNDFDPTPFLNLYKTSVRFDDGLVGSVLNAIQNDDAYSDTIVLVTGDHGQAFNETRDNTWGHNSAFSDYQVRVPFVVKWPGRTPDSIERPTSHADWASTLLTDALGCTNPVDQYSTGVPLFQSDDTDRALPIEQWTQRAIRTNSRVYVFLSWGGYEVRDSAYAPIDEAVDASALKRGFEELSRFSR
ncbi:MAG TPA: sulfatase-like hydrolase/transferase [Pseudomonadales bacterium]|nr:sulfatase-like hydrolase/transferase [Pseudomonadales bacterium]